MYLRISHDAFTNISKYTYEYLQMYLWITHDAFTNISRDIYESMYAYFLDDIWFWIYNS